MGLSVRVPDHTTLSRRQAELAVAMPTQPKFQPLHLVVDATGLKVYGEGEWTVPQHRWNKRTHAGSSLHLGVQEATGQDRCTGRHRRIAELMRGKSIRRRITPNACHRSGDRGSPLCSAQRVIEAIGRASTADMPMRPNIPPRRRLQD